MGRKFLKINSNMLLKNREKLYKLAYIDPVTNLGNYNYYLKAINQQKDKNKTIIIIDITGSEGPNIFGQDVFFLQRIEEEDAIIPYGARLPMSKISNDCKKNGFGLYCAALIRTNGWKIPHDYPIN